MNISEGKDLSKKNQWMITAMEKNVVDEKCNGWGTVVDETHRGWKNRMNKNEEDENAVNEKHSG